MKARLLGSLCTGWLVGLAMYMAYGDGVAPFWAVPASAAAAYVIMSLVLS